MLWCGTLYYVISYNVTTSEVNVVAIMNESTSLMSNNLSKLLPDESMGTDSSLFSYKGCNFRKF